MVQLWVRASKAEQREITTIQGWISTVKLYNLSFSLGLQVRIGKKGHVEKQAVVQVATFCPGRCYSTRRDVLLGWSSGRRSREAWPGMAPSRSNPGMWGVRPLRPFRDVYVDIGCLKQHTGVPLSEFLHV